MNYEELRDAIHGLYFLAEQGQAKAVNALWDMVNAEIFRSSNYMSEGERYMLNDLMDDVDDLLSKDGK